MMILLVLGGMFLISIQPMFMIVSLIFMTLMYSVWIYQIMGTYWFSYALIMVVLSGVLVVFMYMASLIPNESFEVYNLIFIFIFMWGGLLFEYVDLGLDTSYVSFNLWFDYVGVFSLFLVVMLLSLMIMVVWLSWCSGGALRI